MAAAVATATVDRRDVQIKRRRVKPARVVLHAFLITMVVIWMFPIAWA